MKQCEIIKTIRNGYSNGLKYIVVNGEEAFEIITPEPDSTWIRPIDHTVVTAIPDFAEVVVEQKAQISLYKTSLEMVKAIRGDNWKEYSEYIVD